MLGDPRVLVTNPGTAPPGRRYIHIPVDGVQIVCIYRTPRGNLEVAYQSAEFPTPVKVEKVFRRAADLVIAQLFRLSAKRNGGGQ